MTIVMKYDIAIASWSHIHLQKKEHWNHNKAKQSKANECKAEEIELKATNRANLLFYLDVYVHWMYMSVIIFVYFHFFFFEYKHMITFFPQCRLDASKVCPFRFIFVNERNAFLTKCIASAGRAVSHVLLTFSNKLEKRNVKSVEKWTSLKSQQSSTDVCG